jgi:hypothetical protein
VDNWHPFGALFDRFGFRVMYDSNSRLDDKLDTVLKQGNCVGGRRALKILFPFKVD